MSEPSKLSLADKARKNMLLSLVKSITSLPGSKSLPPEYMALINIIVEGGLIHENDPEFQTFLDAEINKLADTIRNWKSSGVKTE